MLACGGFQVRVTPTPKPTDEAPTGTPTARPVAPTATPTRAPTRVPTATPTPAPTQVAGLVVGASARIAASGGVNVRDAAGMAGKVVGRLGPGDIVTLKAGPTQADDYTWWQVDNGKGTSGWVATGTKDDPWLAPEPGSGPAAKGGKLVKRAIRVGDRVQVTTEEDKLLTIREAAGIDAPPVARALPGQQFIVRGGPVREGDFLWWQLEGEQIKGWAAEGTAADRWLTPVEP
jgi:hypothetical protein